MTRDTSPHDLCTYVYIIEVVCYITFESQKTTALGKVFYDSDIKYESMGINSHFDPNFMGNLLTHFISSKSLQLIATSNNYNGIFH